MKAVHRSFFPLFALLETPIHVVGAKVVAQRKLLYLEKLIASLLVATPRLKDQLVVRIQQLKEQIASSDEVDSMQLQKRKRFLNILEGLQVLLSFYLPLVFRIGYLVRSCTWEGRACGTGEKAKHVLEEVFVTLIHLLSDTQAKNEYIRTIAVALLTWTPFMSSLPGVCFAEESCEALLSRMGHRCEVNRHLHGFDATFNLFLTLPLPSRIPRGTRGGLKQGLVGLFASRIRKVVFSDGDLAYCPAVGAKEMHSAFLAIFPDDLIFPSQVPRVADQAVIERVLPCALQTLVGKTAVAPAMHQFLVDHVPRRPLHELREYELSVQQQADWFQSGSRTTRAPKPKPKKVFAPKPRAKRSAFIYNKFCNLKIELNFLY